MGKWKKRLGIMILAAASFMAGTCVQGKVLKEAEQIASAKQYANEIAYEDIRSTLKDTASCLLCGNNEASLMSYYRKFDTIGLVSLNDWYVIEFHLKNYDEEGRAQSNDANTGMWYGSTDEISYDSQGTPSRGMASMQISLKNEKKEVNIKYLQNNLCQACLDKVCGSLTYFETEEETAVPLAVIDFKTLDVYPVQKQNAGYFVRDYWLDIVHDQENVTVKAYYLPERRS